MKKARSAIMADDAFFLFADVPVVVVKAGMIAGIQRGGFIRDKEGIDLISRNGVSSTK